MSPTFSDEKMFWDVQLDIAREVARQPKPSLARLHHDILEEVGQRPNEKLIKYFLSIARIAVEEKEEYLRYIGLSGTQKANTMVEDASPIPALQLANTIANADSPTVLKFRQAHAAEYGEVPSMEHVEYFLKKVQEVQQKQTRGGGEQDKVAFAEELAFCSQPTVLKFRKGYSKRFGGVPSAELTLHFLEKLQERGATPSRDSTETVADSPASRVDFARNAALQNIPTILQFGKAFEKCYGERPPVELIDVFIKNMPRASGKPAFDHLEIL